MATGYTLLRQDEDTRQSDVYDDTIAPTEADYETNPTDLETDLNNVRSQINNLLNREGAGHPAANWWDDIATPATFESGEARGVNAVNQDLHDLERKRVMRFRCTLVDVSVPAAVKATETLDATGGNFANGETVTIGTTVYTAESVFSDTAYYFLIEGTASASLDNLIDCILDGATEGTKFGTGTDAHPDVTAAAGAGDTMDVEAKKAGTAGNLIALAETSANVVWTGGATELSGGAGDLVILGAGELPGNTTAAVGAVSTLGTVVAYEDDFGAATTEEVAGKNAIEPKNLCWVYDADTRDPVQDSSGRTIYALLQSESVTDGHTITENTPTRVQLSFVVITAEGNDLEVVDGADLGGTDINYCYPERSYLLGLNEQDFLKGAVGDTPTAASTTREEGYAAQGVDPVDVTTNSILDLEAAGIYWEIRDDLEATLFRITEGSAGGTSTFAIGSAVDVYDNDAADNDFANGIAVGSSGTEIAINETAGVIERAADLIMRASGAGELYLDDSNQVGSTWAQTDGVKLSENTAEWDAVEATFGGEYSILYMLNAAYKAAQDPVRTWHELTGNVAKDNDVSGPSGANNVDVDFPDLSAGSFLTNHWLYLNGRMMRPGADAAANYDYYPGTALTPDADIRFERNLKNKDVISVVVWPNA